MVYIANSEYCADGAELSKLRNILFTSITRSRAWVRICGVGEEMQQIQREYEQCADNDYNLCFKVPTPKELEAARKLNRERTSTEKKILKTSNYHPTHSHVLPALIRRFHEAKVNGLKEVTCWGDGSPLREFLYVDDLANLCVFLMNNYSGDETVNAGTGKELTIKELTELQKNHGEVSVY